MERRVGRWIERRVGRWIERRVGIRGENENGEVD